MVSLPATYGSHPTICCLTRLDLVRSDTRKHAQQGRPVSYLGHDPSWIFPTLSPIGPLGTMYVCTSDKRGDSFSVKCLGWTITWPDSGWRRTVASLFVSNSAQMSRCHNALMARGKCALITPQMRRADLCRASKLTYSNRLQVPLSSVTCNA